MWSFLCHPCFQLLAAIGDIQKWLRESGESVPVFPPPERRLDAAAVPEETPSEDVSALKTSDEAVGPPKEAPAPQKVPPKPVTTPPRNVFALLEEAVRSAKHPKVVEVVGKFAIPTIDHAWCVACCHGSDVWS